jgi:SAM-dependent methyltransferase
MRSPSPPAVPSAAAANATNNAKSTAARRRRWRDVRAEAWSLLDGVVAEGARVAVVGAGNGDDLPLARLARRAAQVDLIDLDGRAATAARARIRGLARRRVRVLEADATAGEADAVIAAARGEALRGEALRGETVAAARGAAATARSGPEALGDGPYDVVVLDLVLTQLLYPALKGAMGGKAIDAVLLRHGQRVTDGVVERAWAATSEGGAVVVLHDLLGWWSGHEQPFSIERLLALPPAEALALAQHGSLPYGCDPWTATRRAGAEVVETRTWRWPFAPGADYAVFGLVTRRRPPAG